MTIIGSPDRWVDLLGPLVPDILAVLLSSWEEMSTPAPDALEDHITLELVRILKRHRTARDLPLTIHLQPVEIDPAEGQNIGRMDIAFYPPVPQEDIYFCLEAKRLNVLESGQVRSNASEYVRLGMMRFITGQYAKTARNGGMIGYVIDGRVSHAIKNVEQNIRNRHTELGMTAPGELRSSSILEDDRARETQHRRQHDPSPFLIHHLFMAKGTSAN